MTSILPTAISSFAAQVWGQPSDLPADELEDLEAGLSEAYAEDLALGLPTPGAYAAELRAAAGLPAPQVRRSGVRHGIRSLRQGIGA